MEITSNDSALLRPFPLSGDAAIHLHHTYEPTHQPHLLPPSKARGKLYVTGLCLFSVFIALWLTVGLLIYNGGYVTVAYLVFLLFALVSICWNAAEIPTQILRRRRNGHPYNIKNLGGLNNAKSLYGGIHPGAHVALHLVLWLLGVSSAWLASLFWGESSIYGRVGSVLFIFWCLAVGAHLVLFVLACEETRRLNRFLRTRVSCCWWRRRSSSLGSP